MPAIALKGVGRVFGRGETAVHALREVDLEVAAGEFVIVRGPSGSGKTTLLNLLAGLDQPTSGTVVVDGSDLTELGDGALSRFRNQHIGYVFQSFYLEPNRTAVENVSLPLVFASVSAAERRRRSAEFLARVGLASKVDVRARNLSAGQKQRVALARALINKPALLLADEPTANLDSHTGDEILALILELQRKDGVTVMLVSHERELSLPALRTLWVQDGRITDQSAGAGSEGKGKIGRGHVAESESDSESDSESGSDPATGGAS